MPSAPDIKSDDYYKVLGVDRNATDNEIAKAYKKLALTHHPDKNRDNQAAATESFRVITEAYEVLHDPEKRKIYDQVGKQGLQGGGGGGGDGVSFQQADEIFKAFFGGNDPFSMFFDNDGDDGPGGFFNRGGGMHGGPRVVFRGGMPGAGSSGGMPGGFFEGGGFPGFPGMPGGGFPGGGAGMGRGGRGRPSGPPAPTPAHAMPNGTLVMIDGLTKAQEHNGKTGRIAGWDEAKKRYEVELEGDTTLSLRPANLTQQCSVSLAGIESQPEMNGRKARIINYNQQNGRYMVKLDERINGKDVVGLQPANIVLNRGTRVTIQGLSNEQFNGQMSQIIEIDNEAMRYTVQCQNGKQIKIKFDNVLC